MQYAQKASRQVINNEQLSKKTSGTCCRSVYSPGITGKRKTVKYTMADLQFAQKEL
jgi:hypothetical protein